MHQGEVLYLAVKLSSVITGGVDLLFFYFAYSIRSVILLALCMSHRSFTLGKDWDGDSSALVPSALVSSLCLQHAGFRPGLQLRGTEPREGEEMR